MSTPDANALVSHEQDGRILSGVGVSADDLAATMDRHTPEPARVEPDAPTAPAADPAAPAVAAPDEKPSRGRQRFADLTREREEARAEAARERESAAAIKRELEELRSRPAQPAAQPSAPREPERPAEPQHTRPEPSIDEIGTKYENYEQFTRDQALWVHEQQATGFDRRIAQAIEQDRQQRTFAETIERTRAAGRKVYADFDQQLQNGPGAQVPLGRSAQESIERAQFVINHPQSEHLQYAILRDGALAARLQQSDPYTFGLTVASLLPTSAGASPASPARSAVPPPAPYQPVGAGSTTTVPPSAELAKRGGHDFDKSGYRERRAAERGGARRQ